MLFGLDFQLAFISARLCFMLWKCAIWHEESLEIAILETFPITERHKSSYPNLILSCERSATNGQRTSCKQDDFSHEQVFEKT